QRSAANIVTVLPGDEIRALPNFNAAEASGRIPGVAIERDEGEGKFIQIRGTEPRLSNVTIDGSHIPGTEVGHRIPKLDAVPSDILAAIEVSKTLTADMDADAIGGSVNLVTKTPEGRPRGYVAGQFGHITLLNNDAGQGGFTYGGRFGADSKLGFLLGGSIDRNNRGINDVEPSWAVDANGRAFPNEWSQRDYAYYRTRYGIAGDLDYRFSDRSAVWIKGLWSKFLNHGTRYVTDISSGRSAFADTLNRSAVGDSAPSGSTGYGTGVIVTREASQRTPTEQMWGLNAGGRHDLGGAIIDYSLNWGGTRQAVADYRFSPFVFAGDSGRAAPGDSGLSIAYDATNITVPTYRFFKATQAAAVIDPARFRLAGYTRSDGLTTGRDIGGAANVLVPYTWGDQRAAVKLGVRVRDEQSVFTQGNQAFQATGAFFLTQVPNSFNDPQFYSNVTNAYSMGPVPNNGTAVSLENANPGAFQNTTDSVGNALASFSGTERIYAGYVMNDADVGRLHVNLGLRVEQTHASYIGHVAQTSAGVTTVTTVPGSQTYTDVFPSAQLRYGLSDNFNLRLAATRAIARPNYADLAPSLSGSLDIASKNDYANLKAGNPNLRPQHAWNLDLLFERFLSSVGVISGGVFYKRITDFILIRDFTYSGPYQPFVGYRGTQAQNGADGHLLGFEADWVEHLTFLPGIWGGLGFDANYTHVSSKAVVDTTGRQAPLLRQAPDLANVAVTYDRGRLSSRIAWTYNGANIAGYGDGSPSPTGDNYFYAHSQIDGSAIVTLTQNIQMQFQVLNINNAVFGFFNGTPDQAYNFQREYYGRTFFFGTKFNF
ncbi:MAG TPA: TonB-dependent receptor, partial [Gemmatimonadales bacterium]|nr:TonB-dependent receptor [Gemmatimonadales bacterium]